MTHPDDKPLPAVGTYWIEEADYPAVLKILDDGDTLPYEEVSRRLGMPVGSIGPTRLRCLAKLRQLFEPAPGNA